MDKMSRAKRKSPKVTVPRLVAKEKQRRALEMRKAGASYAQIAEQVGYSDASGARRAVVTAFQEITQEPTNELRTLQVERLNHLLMIVWAKINQGDETQIDRALRIMAQMDGLMGTAAAQEMNVRHEGVLVIDGSKNEYIAQMAAMAGADPKELEARNDIEDAVVISDTAEEEMSYVGTGNEGGLPADEDAIPRESSVPSFPTIELDDE